MKNFIFSLFFFALICFAYTLFSQVDPAKENNFEELQNTMTNQVQTDYNLVGFEGRAIQKTEEFADYLEVISNKEYDLALRKHTAGLALKLFYDQSVIIANTDKQISNLKVIKLEDYVDNYLNSEYTKITVEISDFSYSEKLRSRESNDYFGKLKFTQKNSYYTNDELKNESSELKEVEIILIRTSKDFGKNRKDVWSVFLGEIKTVN
jgi:hypothetical protein